MVGGGGGRVTKYNLKYGLQTCQAFSSELLLLMWARLTFFYFADYVREGRCTFAAGIHNAYPERGGGEGGGWNAET